MPQNSVSPQALEADVRQLIANGKSKTALDNAKALHKARNTKESEDLLLDAYEARIRSLLDQKMTAEATSLVSLVQERFPEAAKRLESLKTAAAARGGDLAGLLAPLNDPALDRDRRAEIELRIQTELTDLAALADCPALPPEHNLRQAAGALNRAFAAVTSGPVTDDQIALPEVSHRSPLAPWKFLIRAIAAFHRYQDEDCLKHIDAIRPESVPARLAPALRALLAPNIGKEPGKQTAQPLKPAESALIERATVSFSELRTALARLEEAFETQPSEGRIFKAIRDAVRECRRSAPDVLEDLRQIVSVRSRINELDPERVIAALDGPPRRDAEYFRMLAKVLEGTDDAHTTAEACESWIAFGEHAVREGLFRADSRETATIYLHMAEILGELPPSELKSVRASSLFAGPGSRPEDRWFLLPEKLCERACAIDPHRGAFQQWMNAAAAIGAKQAESVAKKWHEALPKDIEPILFLIEKAEKRNAFPTALSYLEKAERIDAVSPVVRAARLRLLVASVINQLRRKKPHLAEQKLTALMKLPQSGQGDRPAFFAAARHLICLLSGNRANEAAAARAEAEKLLGDIAGDLLIFGVANLARFSPPVLARAIRSLGKDDRARIPAAFARILALTDALGIPQLLLPTEYFDELEKQFPAVKEKLDIEQLKSVGAMGMASDRRSLAWNVSAEGLKRGGDSQAHFLFLRAQALPAGHTLRAVMVASAAAALGRFSDDRKVADRAVEFAGEITRGNSPVLTETQAREVVSRELKHPDFHSSWVHGPDYRDLLPGPVTPAPWDIPPIPNDHFHEDDDEDDDDDPLDFDDSAPDEDEMERLVKERFPAGMPPDLQKMLFELLRQAFLSGRTPDEIIEELMGETKKGGRKP